MAVLTRPDASAAELRSSSRPLRTVEVQAKRRRQIPWIIGGILLIAGSALGFALWADAQSARTEVLVASRSIEAGERIVLGDLQMVSIAADGVLSMVPAAEAESLVGLAAQTSIATGRLLTREDFGQATQVGAGRVVVGAALVPGEYPLPGLRAGDSVIMHAASRVGVDESSAALGSATVWSVESLDTVGQPTLFISLDVAQVDSAAVMDAAAAGQLRLGLSGDAP